MRKLLQNPSQIVTVNTNGKNYKSGKELNELEILSEHSILIEDDLIKDIIPNQSIKNPSEINIIDIKDKVILPGLVDCHTHLAFAGSRANEFRKKVNGISYEEIENEGGGINYTVQATRKSSFSSLLNLVKPRIENFISQGITTLEIKSGYGLDFNSEKFLLTFINQLNSIFPIKIIPTFLGAHTIPNEFKNDRKKYISIIINEMLPYFAESKLTEFCDAFCERTAFSVNEVDEIFSKASSLGMKLRLHTDQFNSIGGIDVALKYNAVSVDHLEIISDDDIEKLSKYSSGVNKKIVAVLLPGVSFFLNHKFAPARKLIEKEIPIALSTDFNPGSSHIHNFYLIMSLACLKMKMTIEETISSVTINAAKTLCLENEIGSIEVNKKADFAIFNTNDYSDIVYSIGKNLNYLTIKNGNIIYQQKEI
ncbi:MAG: imidazolonepropionase [Ignavibacterium sp.]